VTENPHFETADDWAQAGIRLGFTPLRPASHPSVLRIHVRDHRLREVAPTLEAHFDRYVLSQARRQPSEAHRLAHGVTYGSSPVPVDVAGHDAVAYELGPTPAPDDIDPRSPSVVTWADGDIFVLLASDSMTVDELIEEARFLYPARDDSTHR
jgi:hypothetical protein